MHRKIIAILILFFSTMSAFAINWIELRTPLNRIFYLDIDSIKNVDGYYFYNIRTYDPATKIESVKTIQSSVSTPFSAQITSYSVEQYNLLEGDYDNITQNETKNLSTVTYESTVNTAYRHVKRYFQRRNTHIEF